MSRYLLTVVGFIVVAGANISAHANDPLSVHGTWSVDTSDEPILLRGVNFPGHDQNSPRLHSKLHYAEFAATGFNLVRY